MNLKIILNEKMKMKVTFNRNRAVTMAKTLASAPMRYVAFEGKQIPVIQRADVLVVGSTLMPVS